MRAALAVPSLVLLTAAAAGAQDAPRDRSVPIGTGWARTSVNATIFRRDPLTTHGEHQYASWYDAEGRVLLARRRLGTRAWSVRVSDLRGNVRDAHNVISIMADGSGRLHVAWDHHGHPLRYARSIAPGSLELGEREPMVGDDEERVTYPEFHRFPGSGDLLFAYRNGVSGNGDLVLNRYDVETRRWERLCDVLLAGEGERNAYWQLVIDPGGTVHVSWVWRRTGDVRTNHDLGYARSRDGGRSWERSDGRPYALPITAASAEYALRIPEGSALINQTSMTASADGTPYIASYWVPEGGEVPQYQVVTRRGGAWEVYRVGRRTTPFELDGHGSRSVPISRPRLLWGMSGGAPRLWMLFRDAERGDRASLATCTDVETMSWKFRDLTETPVERWEPSIDTALWQGRRRLHVFLQRVGQGQGETQAQVPPQRVSVLEVDVDVEVNAAGGSERDG